MGASAVSGQLARILRSRGVDSYLGAVGWVPMPKNPRTSSRATRTKAIVGISLSLFSVGTAASMASVAAAATPSPTAIVLSAKYAKTAGFPRTLRPAGSAPITSQKGCTKTVGAVYEDAAKQTALITSILICNSPAAASSAFALIHKHYATDTGIAVPKSLGTTGFASSSIAPQYLMAWHTGSRVAITAIDVDVAASRTTTSTVEPPPITTAQRMTLFKAAQAQSALLK